MIDTDIIVDVKYHDAEKVPLKKNDFNIFRKVTKLRLCHSPEYAI